jgi:hypothetical protein
MCASLPGLQSGSHYTGGLIVNVSPVLRLKGTIHSAQLRTVAAIEAADAERDPETGRIVRDPIEARDAYDVVDFTVHTENGGYASVVFKGEFLEPAYGEVPPKDTQVDWPVRNFIVWSGRAGRRFPTCGLAVAGELVVAERSTSTGRRAVESVAS